METGKYSIENGLLLLLLLIMIIIFFIVFYIRNINPVGKGLLTTSRIISFHVSRKEETHSECDFLFFSHQKDKGSVAGRRFDQLQSGVAVGNTKPKELVCFQTREISMRCHEQHRLT